MEVLKEREMRLKKAGSLRDKGISLYPYSFQRTHTIKEVLEDFDKLSSSKRTVKIAGRMGSKRKHGKTLFSDLYDASGKIQLYSRKDTLKEEFDLLSLLDIGDFLGVEGEVFRTKTQEPTLLVNSFKLLGKSLRPLPEKWHGLKDTETRYRQRYLDILSNPRSREIFLIRTKMINAIRSFLNERGFLEVETPILQPLYGGAMAKPFKTWYEALKQEMFLRIADELYLKRLLVGGFEKVYEIAKDFRNEGLDRFHNPEFTQIELYEAYKHYEDMMELTQSLFLYIAKTLFHNSKITYQGYDIDFSKSWRRLPFLDTLEDKTGVKGILNLSIDELKKIAERFGIEVSESITRPKLLDKLFSELIQEKLKEPTFVIDHPKILSPLAKVHRKNPELVERFEVVIYGMELGNAFSELNDPIDQRERFAEQIKLREEYAVMDEDFIEALEYGMPPCAGLGLGIDRMVMLFTDSPSIREVILFPHLRNRDA